MFEKKGQRFLTPGIKEGVSLEVQLLLWYLIDDSAWQMDYLQIFELYKDNYINKLIVIHSQEEPGQKRKVTFHLEGLSTQNIRKILKILDNQKVC